MDGQVEYAKTIREINAIMNTAAKEYKNHVAAMGTDAAATDKLRAEKKKLEIQMEAAQKRTQMLREQYEQMSKSTKTTTGQLAQMYSKLLDSERAETSLQKSLDRVSEGLSEEAQEARAASEKLNDLKDESKLLEAEQKKLVSEFKLQNESLDQNADESEKTALAQKQLARQMNLTEKVVKNLEHQLVASKKYYGENSVEVKRLETKLNEAKTTVAKFSRSLNTIDSDAKKAADGLGKISKKLDLNNLMEASETLQGVSEKLIGIGKSAMDSAISFGESQTNLQANLGVTGKEAQKLNGVVEEVFKNGIVEDVGEASKAVIAVKQNFKNLDDTKLEKITNSVTAIAKRTDTDVNENVRAASQLMTNFGISGDKSLNLIAAGFQKGLNKSDDFLDTLNEYSPQFSQAGFSAEDMLNVINAGMESGAFNTDKAADAVKEFGIRLRDGTIKKNIQDYSSETQTLFKKYEDGKATAADVFQSITKDIANSKSKQDAYGMGVNAMGTQYEDLGDKAINALSKTSHSLTDVNGKADEMAKKSPGEKWESSLRSLETTLKPIGQNLLDSLSPILSVLAKMGGLFSKLPGPIQTFIAVFGGITALVLTLIPVIAALAASFGALDVSLLPIIAVIAAVALAITGIIVVVKNWGKIMDWISDKWDKFTSWLSGGTSSLAKSFVKDFTNMKDGAVGKFNDLKSKAGKTLSSFKENVVNKASEMKKGFVNKTADLKDGAVGKFNDLKSKAGKTISSFKDNVVNKASDMRKNFVGKAGDLRDGAVDKFNSLKSKAGKIFNAAKNVIVSPIEKAKDKVGSIIEKIKGFFSKMKLKIPKIGMPKLPHFKLEGKFSLKPPSVPRLSVDWRAKGAIFTEPTIFGMNNGRLQGAGDAGPEAALPLNDETLGAIGRGIAATMNGNGETTIHLTVDLDGATVARKTVKYTARELYTLQQNKSRGGGKV